MAGKVTPNFDATYGQMLGVLELLAGLRPAAALRGDGGVDARRGRPVFLAGAEAAMEAHRRHWCCRCCSRSRCSRSSASPNPARKSWRSCDDPVWRAHITDNLKKVVRSPPAQCAAGPRPSGLRPARARGGRRAALAHAARPRDGERRLRPGLQGARAARAFDPGAEPGERRAACACLLGAGPLRHLPGVGRGRRRTLCRRAVASRKSPPPAWARVSVDGSPARQRVSVRRVGSPGAARRTPIASAARTPEEMGGRHDHGLVVDAGARGHARALRGAGGATWHGAGRACRCGSAYTTPR